MRTKEVMEGKEFVPKHHIRFMRDILELPALTRPSTRLPEPTSVLQATLLPPTAPTLRPVNPHPTCRDANYFRIWHTLLRTPTPPYALMPPTPPASPSPLLIPADMPDLDIVNLPVQAPP